MIAKIGIDTDCEYVIVYKLKSDDNVFAYSCSGDNVAEKYMNFIDDPETEVISIYKKSTVILKSYSTLTII